MTLCIKLHILFQIYPKDNVLKAGSPGEKLWLIFIFIFFMLFTLTARRRSVSVRFILLFAIHERATHCHGLDDGFSPPSCRLSCFTAFQGLLLAESPVTALRPSTRTGLREEASADEAPSGPGVGRRGSPRRRDQETSQPHQNT